MKFMVTADLDWIMGYLKYGHMEGVVEVDSREELDKLIDTGDIVNFLNIVVDNYRIEDFETPTEFNVIEVSIHD